MNIAIIGNAQHGKDTVAKMLCELMGQKYVPTSERLSELLIFDRLKDKYNYKSPQQCFLNRDKHRLEWATIVGDYTKKHGVINYLKLFLEKSNLYIGLRNKEMLEKAVKEKVIDMVIAVVNPRKPREKSFTIDIEKQSNIIILNNGTIEDLQKKVNQIWQNKIKPIYL